MTRDRFQAIVSAYPRLRLAVLGDYCLDRYLEIDPARAEASIETGLPVHNIIRVRSQPGAAGTVLNNLVALGIGALYPIGFCGQDGEGFELRRALAALDNVHLDGLVETPHRRTFTYCKPLILDPAGPPRELSRLDSKNWTPTPPDVETRLIAALDSIAPHIDALFIMDQVDLAQTGVVTTAVLAAIHRLLQRFPRLLILADSRRGLRDFPPVCMKMNRAELGRLLGEEVPDDPQRIRAAAGELARRRNRYVFITLAEQGIIGANPDGASEHQPALPIRGPIDIVGAGDSVSASLLASLAAGASLSEALELANAAASIVIHQLGTTGTASIPQLKEMVSG